MPGSLSCLNPSNWFPYVGLVTHCLSHKVFCCALQWEVLEDSLPASVGPELLERSPVTHTVFFYRLSGLIVLVLILYRVFPQSYLYFKLPESQYLPYGFLAGAAFIAKLSFMVDDRWHELAPGAAPKADPAAPGPWLISSPCCLRLLRVPCSLLLFSLPAFPHRLCTPLPSAHHCSQFLYHVPRTPLSDSIAVVCTICFFSLFPATSLSTRFHLLAPWID